MSHTSHDPFPHLWSLPGRDNTRTCLLPRCAAVVVYGERVAK